VERHLAPASRDLDTESFFQEPQVFVVNAEESAEPRFGEGEGDGAGSDVSGLPRTKE